MSRHHGPRRRAPGRSRAPHGRLILERLEGRTLPAVTFFNDTANPGKNIVQFTEDVVGASDTLQLSSSGGQLQYQWNGSALSTDLKSSQPGVQPLALSAISRIDVLLGNGNNVLDVNATTSAALFPTPSGIVYSTGNGVDTLILRQDANMTLSATSLTTATGGVVSFSSVELAQLIGGNANNNLNASGFAGNVTLDGANGDDTMVGGSGNDVLLGTEGKDQLDGRGGNDQLFSGNSGPTLFGGDGDDSLVGGNGADFLDGGAGNDSIFGSNGQDTLLGGAGNDTCNGGNGIDLVDGGTGTDRVFGSANVSWTVTDTTLTGE